MIEATYVVNNYIKTQGTSIEDMDFVPGRSAHELAPSHYVLYSVSMGMDPELYMVHMDTVKYRIIHTDFEKIAKYVSMILGKFNVEDIENTFMQRVVGDPNFRFQHAQAVSSDIDQGYFSDKTRFFYCDLNILITYTVAEITPKYAVSLVDGLLSS